MGSIFSKAIASAQKTIQLSAAVDVTYADKAGNWVAIKATPGKTDFQLQDQFGAVTEYRSRDYIVMTEDLILNGVNVLPERGHTITEQIGNQLHKYEVARRDSEQPWRYSSTGHNVIRIHTVLKGITNV